jgi:phage minor structural protein
MHVVLNGEWYVKLVHPIDDISENIVDGAVLKVPTLFNKEQLFIIRHVDKADYDVQATAYPLFYMVKTTPPLWDTRCVNMNGQDALNTILSGTSFKGVSDITDISTCYFNKMNRLQAINGNADNTFMNRWGGEIVYDDYTIKINKRIGSDKGARCELGYNLKSVQEVVNTENLITRIYPQAYNGYVLPNGECIDSPYINNYPDVYWSFIQFDDVKLKEDAQEDDASNGITVCDTLEDLYKVLRKRASDYFTENNCDVPNITYKVDIVDLARLDAYKDIKNLVSIGFGDTVHIKHRKLNIETKARLIECDYDCILKKYGSMTLGDYETKYFENADSVIQAAQKVIDKKTSSLIAEKIKGIIDATQASLYAQRNIAKKMDYRAMKMEDLDPDSPTYGATCYGTSGLEFSDTRTEDGADWKWGNAFGPKGLIANAIITGILSDKSGSFYLNMDTGELVMNDGTFKGVLNTVQDINVGAEINMQPRTDGVAQGSVWADIKAVDADGNVLPERIAFRSVKSDGKYLSHSIKLICGDASVSVDNDGSITLLSGTNKVKVSTNGVDIITKNNEISLSENSSTIKIDGKTGLTGTYTVTKSVTTRSGIVTGVE